MPEQRNAAKFAFYYMLSLVSLIFMSTSVGTILFQIINKAIPDTPGIFSGTFTPEALRYAISALIISTPIYYFITREIYKNLYAGNMEKDSGVRRWLTYFILFVSAVVMIGGLIATLNKFLNGELAIKFILKSPTSIMIAALIFAFYFYDIKREEIAGKKDKFTFAFFSASLAIVVIVLVAGFFFIESPAKVRARKTDMQVIENFNQAESSINNYFTKNKKVPEQLEALLEDKGAYFIVSDTIRHPQNKEVYEYNKVADNKYEICAEFLTSNKELKDYPEYDKFNQEKWEHDAGRTCFTKTAEKLDSSVNVKEVPRAVPAD